MTESQAFKVLFASIGFTDIDGPIPTTPIFIFDVESIGLHGEPFAVAGGIYIDGAPQWEFRFCCPEESAGGTHEDRDWVKNNVPTLPVTHSNPAEMADAFWNQWIHAKRFYPHITMAGECVWPVEAKFLSLCISRDPANRKWDGPYPFHDISSIMLAAGMSPMETYERTPMESPAHDPLADARLSARLLYQALTRIDRMAASGPAVSTK